MQRLVASVLDPESGVKFDLSKKIGHMNECNGCKVISREMGSFVSDVYIGMGFKLVFLWVMTQLNRITSYNYILGINY